MRDEYYIFVGMGILLSFLLPLGYIIGQNQKSPNIVVLHDSETSVLGGLELQSVGVGTYSYDVPLQNYDAFKVKVYWILKCENSSYRPYVEYVTDYKNGTVLEGVTKIYAHVDFTVKENPYAENSTYSLFARGVYS